MSQKVRVAMIGAGSMANCVHYPSLASFDDVEIAAICDVDGERLHHSRPLWRRRSLQRLSPNGRRGRARRRLCHRPAAYHVRHLDVVPGARTEPVCGEASGHHHPPGALGLSGRPERLHHQVSFQRRSCPMVVQLREECLKRGPIVHAECSFYKYDINPYLQARDHMMDDGVRHRHAALDVRRRGGRHSQRDQRVDAGHQLHLDVDGVRQRRHRRHAQ